MPDVRVLDFFAPWCAPCDTQSKHIEELREQTSDDVVIEEIDIEDDMDLANEYNVRSVPTVVVEVDDVVQAQFTGVTSATDIAEELPQ